jgi:hypothetical protein
MKLYFVEDNQWIKDKLLCIQTSLADCDMIVTSSWGSAWHAHVDIIKEHAIYKKPILVFLITDAETGFEKMYTSSAPAFSSPDNRQTSSFCLLCGKIYELRILKMNLP